MMQQYIEKKARFTAILSAFALLLSAPQISMAESIEGKGPTNPAVKIKKIDYISDPVFAPINDTDKHPLSGLFSLAEDGDPRAQYILGDLFSKGKGGIKKDLNKASLLFQHSAKGGTGQAFIRLAALAKNDGDLAAAYSWYDIALDRAKDRDIRKWAKSSRRDLSKNTDLSSDQKKQARKFAKDWKIARLETLDLGAPDIEIPAPKPKALGDKPEIPTEPTTSTPVKETLND